MLQFFEKRPSSKNYLSGCRKKQQAATSSLQQSLKRPCGGDMVDKEKMKNEKKTVLGSALKST